MAHECPICYALCHCGGDIDDIQLDGTEEANNCHHCNEDDDEDYNEDDDLFYDEFGNPSLIS